MSYPAALDQVRRMLDRQPTCRLEDGHLLELFRQCHDEEAFAELVRRHGPLVLGVCRRVLHDTHDADDVFQATFLVLARKADSIRKRQSLPSWLHGVAYRLSLKSWAGTRRRREREQRFLDRPALADDPVGRRERQAILDEELRHLPERQRAPLLLCYAEGMSQEEAARALGWSRGTLKRRLERGRDVLRTRLTRRGLALSAGAGVGFTSGDLLASVPALLAATATKLATLMTAPEAVGAPALSAKVALLADAMIRSMFVGKLKMAAALVLVLALLGVGASVAAHRALASETADAVQQVEPPTQPGVSAEKPPLQAPRLDRDGAPLPEEALARIGSTRLKHGGLIGFLGFTPDGKTLVSQGTDGVRTWDAATGRQLRQLPQLSGDWQGASLSPDGRRLATTFMYGNAAGNQSGIAIWDVASGDMVRTLGAGTNPAGRVCFSPDGKMIASSGDHKYTRLVLWDVASGKQLRSWTTPNEVQIASLVPLVFTPDGKTLITAHADQTVRFWEAATGKERRQFSVAPDTLAKIALSPDGALLAVLTEKRPQPATYERRLHFVDVASGKEVRQTTVAGEPRDSGQFGALAFSPDGRSLFGAMGGSVFVWDAATGEQRQRFSQGLGRSRALAVSPDGATLAAAVCGTSIHLFDLKRSQDRFPVSGHQDTLFQVALARNGRVAVTSSRQDHAILIWDAASGRELRRLEGYYFALAADDHTLGVQDGESSVQLWDLAGGKELRKLTLAGESFFGLALSPDGKILAVRSRRGTVRLYDAVTGKQRSELDMGARWDDMAFSADGGRLITWSAAHVAHVWDVATGREVRRFPFQPTGKVPMMKQGPMTFGIRYQAQLSPDGQWLAYTTSNRALLILDAASGRVARSLENFSLSLTPLAFSPDGRTLAWVEHQPSKVHLLELATGQERHTFPCPTGEWAATLAFSADGRKLIVGQTGTTALVWDLTGKRAAGAAWGKPLSAAELDACWSDLAGTDAALAYQTVRRLVAVPAQAIPWLRARLHPATPTDSKQVVRWLTDLDSDDFETRERASKSLAKLDADLSRLYRKALDGNPSAERKRRVETLLEEQTKARLSPKADGLRTLRALEVLELAGTAEARRVLETLAAGAPGAPLTVNARAALRRIGKTVGGPND